jgi:hypothetical protein
MVKVPKFVHAETALRFATPKPDMNGEKLMMSAPALCAERKLNVTEAA